MNLNQKAVLKNEIRIEIISKMVLNHLFSNEYRCYLRPTKNGFPINYAQTFKITKVRQRRKRK